MLPVIFLTALSSEDDRIRGFRLGADDYVTKPFRFEELDLRVAKTLRRTAQTVQDTRDQLVGSGLRGDLSQVGLSSLLVLIEMERKTGLLQLRAPNGPSAQVLVREGKVVHARLDDPTSLSTPSASTTCSRGAPASSSSSRASSRAPSRHRVDHAPPHGGRASMDEANNPNGSQRALQIPPIEPPQTEEL